jgi:hypothetical protein
VLSGVKAEADVQPTQKISNSISAPVGAEGAVLLEEPTSVASSPDLAQARAIGPV